MQVTSSAEWESVKVALIRSVRTGVFFDRKYWARHSKSGDVLRPIHFSSAVVSDQTLRSNNCMSRFTNWCMAVLSAPSGEVPR